MFCHLANIAYRTGHTIDYDAPRQRIIGNRQTTELWQRDHQEGWKPIV